MSYSIQTQTIQTTCAYCGVGCGIDAKVNQTSRTVELIGSDTHPANHGRLCSKGSALGNTVSLEGRLLQPTIGSETVNWDTALSHTAARFSKIIQQHGPDAVAFYVSGQLLTEDYYVANKLMKGFIGTGNIDTNSRLCMSSSVVGHKRAFGTDTVPGCYDDFEQADLITLVGSNTAWCHPVLFQRIKRHKENNPHVKVIVIDPRRTQTCDIADLHLDINLGTDTWLFNGLLNSLVDNQQTQQEFIEQHCQGFDSAIRAASISSGELNKLATKLGISRDKLQLFYQWFGETEKSITLYSQGVNQSSSGSDKVNSIINCHLATGRIGRPGMGPFSITGQPNAMGGREVGGLATTLAAHLEFNQTDIDIVKRFWQAPNMAKKPGRTAVDLFEAIEKGDIKAVWIMATNPVVSLPNADQVKRALNKAELVVVSDCIADTDTNRFAHVRLPALGWSEKDGTVTNSERRISRQRALFPPAGNAKPDWWIISQVAQRMGYEKEFDYANAASIFREHAALSGYENNEQQRLRDFNISALHTLSDSEYDKLNPLQWPVTREHPQGKARFFAQGGFYTPNRKANLLAIVPTPPKNVPCADFPYRLNTGRIRDQWHTMTRSQLAPQLNQHISEPFVQVNPKDATLLNVSTNQLLRITSRWGSMVGRAIITHDVKPGDIFAPMHWTDTHSTQGRINPVVNPEVDSASLQPESKHTPVNLQPVNASMYGCIMTRQTIRWPKLDYLVSSLGQQHTRLELAHSSTPMEPIAAMLQWLGYDNHEELLAKQYELISFSDPCLGRYRIAILNGSGQLQAIAMIGPSQDLPDRSWLAQQFTHETLNQRTRQALLSGYAPAGEDIGRIICACFSVGEKTIQSAITQGCQTPEAVGARLKAGTNCGSCIPEIKALCESPDTAIV